MRSAGMWGLAALVPILLSSSPARGDERDTCLEASTRAQKSKLNRKLKEAREQLLVCSRSECPATVRQDCSQWMNEVLVSLPSIVIGARDVTGHDLVQVKVTIDNVVAAERLEGKAIDVDPGVHAVRYEAPGFPAIEDQIVVREGEKNRPITVTFGGGGGGKQPDPKDRDRSSPAPEIASGGAPVGAYVVGGLGLVALGVAGYLGLHSNGRAKDLRDGCGQTRTCTQSDVDAVDSERTAAWVVGGAGVAAIAVAVILLVTHSSGSKTSGRNPIPVASGSTSGFAVRF